MSTRRQVLTPQERRRRNHDEMKAAILDAAREVMREEGVAALNLQEVAKRVGMRAPSLYTYFKGRTAIYEALFVMGIRIFRERVEHNIEQYGYELAAIEVGLTNYMSFADEYPELYQLVFERPVPGFVPSPEGMAEGMRLLEITTQLMRDAIESGTLVTDLTPEQVNNLFAAVAHGLTALKRANEPDLPIGEGRFGSLIPAVAAVLQAAWAKQD